MARYTVDKTHDAHGGRYIGGPLRMVDTDSLKEAMAYVYAHGGEVIDHQDRQGWKPGVGWYDVSACLEMDGE